MTYEIIPVPPEVTRVAGCDCGGHTIHRTDCALWTLPYKQAMAVIDEAVDRLADYTAQLNRRIEP